MTHGSGEKWRTGPHKSRGHSVPARGGAVSEADETVKVQYVGRSCAVGK